jgi:hypothetical protein
MVLLASDCNGLRLVVTFCIGIERTGLCIVPHLWVGTHIDRAVQSWLEELDVKPKLILISSASRIIYIKVELEGVLYTLGNTSAKQFSTTDYLNTTT